MSNLCRITDLSLEQFTALVKSKDHKPFRAKQTWQWVFKKHVTSVGDMTNLPKEFRAFLKVNFLPYPSLQPAEHLVSKEDKTEKYLFRLADGECIESVLIRAPGRLTACISSQVGCALGCTFCASTKGGFKRDLTTGEIVEQVIWISKYIGDRNSLNNIVFMGIGEPLLNYDNVLQAIRILNDPAGMDIGIRKITVSTSGIIPGIRRLAKEVLGPRLCVSIHSPDDLKRSKLLPVNKKYPLNKVIKEIRSYCETTQRQVAIEYTLIKGVNDSPNDARKLVRLFHDIPCSFNLIACNRLPESKLIPSPPAACEKFKNILARAGFRTTLRIRKGTDINAACGQLRAKRRKQT